MVRWECRGPWSLRSRPRRPDHGPHDRGRPRAPASEPSPMNIGLFGNTNNGPFMLAEMLRQLGHQVVLDLRRFGNTSGYYVDEVHEISFGCRTEEGGFDGDSDRGMHVIAKVVDFDALPSGVTTITLDRCSATNQPFERVAKAHVKASASATGSPPAQDRAYRSLQ